ncbi:uncharacterized protein DUF2255 [Christiangramia gaetbulicola]|uniref:Uncharacterized protein DUF2255 n=1 Tax=Christiangramia gaetbulicola TaxID=703340 RepID=A0A2T6AI58_9FLAO|nr:DUF2255 family protein [Christiangramia gaetbulicola]PTX43500.1 uncharacterized protein DUF2255 [Christiangramia gaetbulicola]
MHQNKFPERLYNYLTENTLIEIKGGTTRENYLKIWMVEVDKRLFARSWQKSEKSWFTEFQKTGIGEIKYGHEVIKVKGEKVDASNTINKDISQAYLDKYDQPENLIYSEGIAQPEYYDYTMEFTMIDKIK